MPSNNANKNLSQENKTNAANILLNLERNFNARFGHNDLSSSQEQFNKRNDLLKALSGVTKKIIQGEPFDKILDDLFNSMAMIIPYDRISTATIHDGTLTSCWIKSNMPVEHLKLGYSVKLEGGSLEKIIQTREPRIIENLQTYLQEHPNSMPTQLAIKDGILSSLTYPLISQGKPIGVIFFSSSKPNTYTKDHIEIFQALAEAIALILEQDRLYKFYEQNTSKEKMFSIIAHDLRTSVSIISGFLNLLAEEDGPVDSQRFKIYEIMRRNCGSMLDLINDLSDYGKLSREQMDFNFQDVNLFEFINGICENANIMTSNKNIYFQSEVSQELPPVAHFDSLRIQQVILNLISNAVKFSMPETEISFKASLDKKGILFSVTDQGPGIPEDELDKLFKEFSKTSVRPTQGESSTGLGLAIAKQIVEKHGGSIFVKTKLGKGSSFEFWIPLSQNLEKNDEKKSI